MGVFFATSVLKVDEALASFLYIVNRPLVVFTLFWTFHQLTGPLSLVLQRANNFLSEAMIDWIVKIARVLFGVAVALGAQDLFKNLIAGFFVIGERRFQPGDWINVEGIVEGTVLQIGFRTTTVRRFDREPALPSPIAPCIWRIRRRAVSAAATDRDLPEPAGARAH